MTTATVPANGSAAHLATPQWASFCAADDAWSDELGSVFGKRSGDMRYTDRGKTETPRLAALYAARTSAWLAVEEIRTT